MSIREKIGQLSLITPGGGIPTGSAVSTDVEEKIKLFSYPDILVKISDSIHLNRHTEPSALQAFYGA
jgi:hypothetical protein